MKSRELSTPELITFWRSRARGLLARDEGEARDAEVRRKQRFLAELIRDRLGRPVERVTHLNRSKIGNDSFKVDLGTKSLKCFECWTAEFAERVRCLTETFIGNGITHPRVHCTAGRFVVSDWVEGTPLSTMAPGIDREMLRRIVQHQVRIQECPVPADCDATCRYDSLFYFLLFRAVELSRGRFRADLVPAIIGCFDNVRAGLRPKVNFVDFTLRNIVLSDGQLMLIDNEHITVDCFHAYAVLNAYRAGLSNLGRGMKRRYFSLHREHGNAEILDAHPMFWKLVWDLRASGKNYYAGRTGQADRITDRINGRRYRAFLGQ